MVVRLHGGLANQMFQYAFGESVGAVRKEEVFYNRIGPERLDVFNIKPIKFAPESGPLFGDISCYDEKVYSAPNGTSFVGCWQTEKYFDENMVRRELSFKNKPSEESQKTADTIVAAGATSAFLHVRRGDYVFDYNQRFHGMPTMRYYNEAVERIRARHKDARFWVFSDDPDWCLANFPSDFTVVGHNKIISRDIPGREHEDIWLMSLCHHGTIANSSFSWWGAWFGTQPDKLIFAPKQWFIATHVGSSDIVPERWTKLDN
jgi:hypothetical protein